VLALLAARTRRYGAGADSVDGNIQRARALGGSQRVILRALSLLCGALEKIFDAARAVEVDQISVVFYATGLVRKCFVSLGHGAEEGLHPQLECPEALSEIAIGVKEPSELEVRALYAFLVYGALDAEELVVVERRERRVCGEDAKTERVREVDLLGQFRRIGRDSGDRGAEPLRHADLLRERRARLLGTFGSRAGCGSGCRGERRWIRAPGRTDAARQRNRDWGRGRDRRRRRCDGLARKRDDTEGLELLERRSNLCFRKACESRELFFGSSPIDARKDESVDRREWQRMHRGTTADELGDSEFVVQPLLLWRT
jgi:hypothetical protein